MIRLLCILLVLGHNTYGQTTKWDVTQVSPLNFRSDTLNNSPNKDFNNKIKLVQIDQSQAKVDLRLYTLHSLSNTKTVRRLFLVDTTWAANEFDEWNKPIKVQKYKLEAKSSFDSLFSRLIYFNIITLPNQSELKNKMHKDVQVTADGDTTERKIIVMDGEGYTVEIKIGNNFRVYRFDNPETYSNFYDNVPELQDYLNIVQTFDKFLRRK